MDKPGRQQWLARSAADDHRPLVILSANSSWNLLNFREVLIDGFEAAGYRLAAFVPEDSHADHLRARVFDAVNEAPLFSAGRRDDIRLHAFGGHGETVLKTEEFAACFA